MKILAILAALFLSIGYGHAQTYEKFVEKSFDFLDKNDLVSAEESLRAAMHLEPGNPNNYALLMNLGTIQRRQGKLEDALLSYTAALSRHPNNEAILENRAGLYTEMGEIEKATNDYNALLILNPHHQEALYCRAMLHLQHKNYLLAEQDFDKILEVNEKSVKGRLGHAILEKLRGNYDESERIFNYLISEMPREWILYEGRADLYFMMGKNARAMADINRVFVESTPTAALYVLRGKVKLAQYEKASAALDFKKAEDMGYVFEVGPECEFFLFHTDDNGLPTTLSHEKAGYFDLGPTDLGENVRRDMVLTLEDMGFEIEASHHEVAPAQHEIDFKYDEALKTADNIMTFKLTVKTIAKRHGLYATFMPKPKYGTNGSGMHVNMSLAKDGKNIFADENDTLGLSEDAYHFIAGLMKHAKGMAVLTNPLVNSYKRLVPGYEAPVYIAWSATNRSPLIRIPASRGQGTRVELRNPDPSANPYLVLATCLAAGLDGIKNKLEVPASVDCNIFEMTDEERKHAAIEVLPESLYDAVRYLNEDKFICDVLGEHITSKYTEAKLREWNDYKTQVTQWELDEYLYKF